MSRRTFHLLLLPVDVLGLALLIGALIGEPALWIPGAVGGGIYGIALAIHIRKHPLK